MTGATAREYDDGAGPLPAAGMAGNLEVPRPLRLILTAGWNLTESVGLPVAAYAVAAWADGRDAGMVANVLVDGGRVKIADFGIAQAAGASPASQADLTAGTPGYLSPEQMAGLPATPASDLYSLGMIAYECLTGRPPFRGSPLAVAHAYLDRPLPPLPATVPAPVVKLVGALTAKDPKDRPDDAMAVAEWARRVRDHPQVIQAAAGPIRAGVSLPAEPARVTTTSLRRWLSGFLLDSRV